MEEFDAPWSPLLLGITVTLVTGVLAAALYNAYAHTWGTAAALASGLGLLSLLSVRGYALRDRHLVVRRPGWATTVDLTDLVEVVEAPDLVGRSVSLWTTRGLFGVVGYVYKRGIGVCRAYVTDQRRTVLLRFRSGRSVAVSPGAPDAFIAAVRARAAPATAVERGRPAVTPPITVC